MSDEHEDKAGKGARTGRSRASWVIIALGQLLVLVVLLEIGAPLLYPMMFEEEFSRDALRKELSRESNDAGPPGPATEENVEEVAPTTNRSLLHPYVGYVRDSVEGEPTNVFGYLGAAPVVRRSPDRLNVALLGGSVALHMYRNAGNVLRRTLSRAPAYSGKEIRLVTLALPGYKQPQQLMALTYMLYLGAQYDIVINLDGFNEIALPFAENLPQGTYHHHPRLWSTYADTQQSTETIVLAAEMIQLRARQEALRERFASPLVNWSRLALLIWKGLDRETENRIRELDAEYRSAAKADLRPLGPLAEYGDDYGPYFEEAARSWMRASWEMQALAGPHRFQYFHFLQPNQYVPGSKPLSRREMRVAHVDGYPGQTSVFDKMYKWTAENG